MQKQATYISITIFALGFFLGYISKEHMLKRFGIDPCKERKQETILDQAKQKPNLGIDYEASVKALKKEIIKLETIIIAQEKEQESCK